MKFAPGKDPVTKVFSLSNMILPWYRISFLFLYRLKCFKQEQHRTVVVAQLVERLLKMPEVCSSNPDIGKIYIEHLFTVSCIEKTKIKKKRS